jgi:hypothetical protein
MVFGVYWPLLAFELGSYVVWAVCLIHALRQGARRRERLALLLTGTIYGLLLETATIYQLHAYYYGHYLIMFIGQVPLTIAVGWGVILYGSVAFADKLALNSIAWAAAVGLLGLNIDLTMDAVAIRVGMWNWYTHPGAAGLLDPRGQWFGVPFGNFFAWFIVLTSVAALFRRLKPGEARSVAGVIGRSLAALLGSLIILVTLDELYVLFTWGQWWPVAVEIAGSIALIALGHRGKSAAPREPAAAKGPPALTVPLFFHLYFISILIACVTTLGLVHAGTDAHTQAMRAALPQQAPVLLAVSAGMVLAGLGVHLVLRGRHGAPARAVAAAQVATPESAE